MLTAEHLKTLARPFPDDKLGVKIQSVSKNKDKAMLVLYLQHTDVMDRLEEVDPGWSAKTLERWIITDQGISTHYCRTELTILGVTRENVGDGNEPKGAHSDSIKRAAMTFGVGRYLYDSELVWVDYNESTDKYKQWTVQEYNARLKGSKPAPVIPSGAPSPVSPKPALSAQPIQASPLRPPEPDGEPTTGGVASGIPQASVVAPKAPVTATGIRMEQPPLTDAELREVHAALGSKVLPMPGGYLIQTGKHNGKTIAEMDPSVLSSYCVWIYREWKTPGKRTGESILTILANYAGYILASAVGGQAELAIPDTTFTSDDIPF